MRKGVIASIIFLLVLVHFTFSAERKAIAILGITDSGADIKGMNNMVMSRLEQIITQLGRLTLVERAKLKAVLKEQNLGASGIVDDKSAVKIGNILGVNYLMSGDIVQGTITPPVERTRQRYKRVKQSDGKYINVPTTFSSWFEVKAIAQVAVKVINVETGAIKYSKTYGGHRVKRLNQKSYSSKAAYDAAKRREQKAENFMAIYSLIAKKEIASKDLSG